jgi:hypothetical protein
MLNFFAPSVKLGSFPIFIEVHMWWECSECGARTERVRRPVLCADCGIAGAVFVATSSGGIDDFEPDDLRAAWLLGGIERARGAPLRARPGAAPWLAETTT